MYLEFFKLQELPFRLTADPRFHYRGVEHVRAQESLRRGLEEGGCVWVTGEAGVGKTILVQDLLGLLPSDWLLPRLCCESPRTPLTGALVWEAQVRGSSASD